MISLEENIIAYFYSTPNFSSDIHKDKTKKFSNLIKTCNIALQWLPESNSHEVQQHQLCFIDMFNQTWTEHIPEEIAALANQCRVILFNVTEQALDEKQVLLAGIQGVFYLEDRADIILKGIERIKKDECWFKRETMNLAIAELLKNKKSQPVAAKNLEEDSVLDLLTRREKMIFDMVSNGAPNKEIADNLNISTNTVKTHIYSIFRKTSSRNRIELMAWSQQQAFNSKAS